MSERYQVAVDGRVLDLGAKRVWSGPYELAAELNRLAAEIERVTAKLGLIDALRSTVDRLAAERDAAIRERDEAKRRFGLLAEWANSAAIPLLEGDPETWVEAEEGKQLAAGLDEKVGGS